MAHRIENWTRSRASRVTVAVLAAAVGCSPAVLVGCGGSDNQAHPTADNGEGDGAIREGGSGDGASSDAGSPSDAAQSDGATDDGATPTDDGAIDGTDGASDDAATTTDDGASDGSAPTDGATGDTGAPADGATGDTGTPADGATGDTGTRADGATSDAGTSTDAAANDGGTNDATVGTDGAPTDGAARGDGASDATTADGEAGATGDAGGSADGGDASAGPVASFSAAPIDLGPGDCGGTAVTSTVSIRNVGNAPLTVGAGFGTSSVFSVSSNVPSGGLAAGATGTLTISASVPSTATAAAALTGNLTITTNDPAHASTTVRVAVTPRGATLAWASGSPTSANFGYTANGAAATPITLTLDNIGNADATGVAISAPADTQFSMGPRTAATVAAGSGVLTLTAGFTPTSLTPATSTSTITVGAGVPVCGASVTSIGLSGQGAVGSVSGWPTTIDFGGADCGAATGAASQTFTLTNTGNLPVSITAVDFSGASGYTTNLTTSSVIPAATNAAPGTLDVQLTPPAIPPTSAVPGNYDASVSITTNMAGDTAHAIALHEQAVGAILAFDTSQTANFGNFGPVPAFSAANGSFNVVNTGNYAPTVTLATAAPFRVSPTPFVLSPGAKNAQSATATFAPMTFGPATGGIAISVAPTDVLCAPLPSALPLGGIGESGGIAFNANSFSFTAPCGSSAPTQKLTITNVGNQPMTWSATQPAGLAAYGLSPTGSTVPPKASVDVTITPPPIPQYPTDWTPAPFAGEIDITTDIPNDTTHKITLGQTPIGDVIVMMPATTLDLGSTPINNKSQAIAFTLVNLANAASGPATINIASGNRSFLVANQATVPSGPTGTNVGAVFAAPNTAGTVTSSFSFTTPDPLCAPLPNAPGGTSASGQPGSLRVTATATAPGPNIQPTTVNFGLVNCGASASAQQITITNTGNEDFTIASYSVDNTAYYRLSSSSPTGLVQANGANAVTLTVTPSAIPATEPSGAVPDSSLYAGTITIRTQAAGNVDNTYTVPIQMGAQGVIVGNQLSSTNWTFPQANYRSSSSYEVFINNTGNWPLQATLTSLSSQVAGSKPVFSLASTPTAQSSAPGNMAIVANFTPSAPNTSASDQGQLVIAPVLGGVFCAPLPASWNSTIALQGTGGP